MSDGIKFSSIRWIICVVVVLLFGSGSGYHEPGAEGISAVYSEGDGGAEWLSAASPPIRVSPTTYRTLRVYCWPGTHKNLRALWYSAYFRLEIEDESFHLYRGSSPDEVNKQYKSTSRWFALLPWRDRSIRLNPFTPTCLGIDTNKPYMLTLKIFPIDPYRFLVFIAGVLLILLGRWMSRNIFFHYSSGIGIALVGSLLVAVFLVSRMIPRRAAAGTFLVGGWAVVLYFLQTLWKNFRETMYQHRNYVAGYVVIVSTITFMLIYRFGGVRNARTMDIIQWSLQIIGAVLIYLSCTIEYAGFALILLTIGLDMLVHSNHSLRKYSIFNRLFPPRPPKLLTQAEYDEIGRKETMKELQKLRKYANSPDAKAWSLVKKLKNPSRFSSFVEDGTHLSNDEVDFYEREVSFDGFEDDERVPESPPKRTASGPHSPAATTSWRNSPAHSPQSASSSWRNSGSGSRRLTASQWRASHTGTTSPYANGNGYDDDAMDYE